MSRRFTQDRKAVSVAGVIVVILLIIVGWYFASIYYPIPFIDDFAIDTLNEQEPDDIYFDMRLYNPTSNTEWLQNYPLDTWDTGSDADVSFVPDEYDVLDLVSDTLYDADGVRINLKTNAPSKLLGDKWRIYGILEQHKLAGNEYAELINEYLDYEPHGEKNIDINLPHVSLISQSLSQWNEIDLFLYNPSNIVEAHIEFAIVRP